MIIRYRLQWESADKKAKQFVGDINENNDKQFCYYVNIDGSFITNYIILWEEKVFKNITNTEIGKQIIKIIKRNEGF